jgi:hypothetical protein
MPHPDHRKPDARRPPIDDSRPNGNRVMRAVMLAAGVGAAVAGLAVATHQTLVWMQMGFWPPIRFSELWFALGGAAPDLVWSNGLEGLVAKLLDQPLSEVLLLGGTCIAWIGASRTSYAGTRF